MKQFILLAVLVFGMNASAQIEVQEVDKSEDKIFYSMTRNQRLVRYVEDGDTMYVMYYRNYKYQHITSMELFRINGDEELNQLLDLMEKVVDNKETFDIKLSSGEPMRMKKAMKSCELITSKGWTYFDYKNIDKIREAIK